MPGQRYAVTRSVFEPRANTSRPSTEAQSTPTPKDFSINIRLHTVLSTLLSYGGNQVSVCHTLTPIRERQPLLRRVIERGSIRMDFVRVRAFVAWSMAGGIS
jgi:hypothetical protein